MTPRVARPVQAAGGSGTAGTTLGSLEVTDATSFRRALETAYCDKLFGCPLIEGDNPDVSRLYFGTPEACADITATSFVSMESDRDLDAKLQTGDVVLSTEQLPTCLAALADCTDPWVKPEDIPACRSILRGKSPLGGACSRPEDCADDVFCVTSGTCPGTCAARPSPLLGEDCAGSCDQSQGDTACRELLLGEASTCALVTRFPAAEEGEPCSVGNFGSEVRPCQPDLYCLPGEPVLAGWPMNLGSCRAFSALGAACGTDFPPCSGGESHCVDGFCRPLKLAKAVGEPCDVTTFCDMTAQLYCTTDGVCASMGDGTEGSPCKPSATFAVIGCEAGLVCFHPGPDAPVDPADPNPDSFLAKWSTCGKPRAGGEACFGSEDCQSLFCRSDYTCAPAYCCVGGGSCDYR